MSKKFHLSLILIIICASFVIPSVFGKETNKNSGFWSYWMRYNGLSGQTPQDNSGGIYPRGTAAAIFQDGLVWGAIVDGQIRVGGQTYRVGTVPLLDRIYRIRPHWRAVTDVQLLQDAADFFVKPISSVTEKDIALLREQYEKDWREWPVDEGVPYVDVNGNGVYDPVLDEDGNPIPEEGDYPGIASADQVVWFNVNDQDEEVTRNLYGSPPMGIELQVTAWAYQQPKNLIGQILFKRYRLINISDTVFDSMYVSQWSDPDIGNYTDDLVGCDSVLNLGFAYNGFETDSQYETFGLVPPVIGYDMLQGPVVESPGDTAIFDLKIRPGYRNLPMASFSYWTAASIGCGDPDLGSYRGTLKWYNLLRGFFPCDDVENPTPYTHRNTGQPTKFPLNGDPVTGEGDVDGQGNNFDPADRRMCISSGPFVMQPGDTQEVVVAVLGGLGPDYLRSITELKKVDQVAQYLYNNHFTSIPKAPPPPEISVTPLGNKIILSWGHDQQAVEATEETIYPDSKTTAYRFEGYNVYQLTGLGPFDKSVRIATFDVINGVQLIESRQYLPEFGGEGIIPVQFGRDTGIQRFMIIDKNYLTGEALFPGSTYYFAVTAYNYNPHPRLVDTKTFESPMIPVTVIAQSPKPGVIYDGKPGQQLKVIQQFSADVNSSDGEVEVMVVDPSAVTGKDYRVTFTQQESGEISWNLWRETELVLKNQPQLSLGDLARNNAPIKDGLLIKVASPPAGISGCEFAGGTPWMGFVQWNGSANCRGVTIGINFFGSTIDDEELVDVELRFAGGLSNEFPDRWSQGAVYRRDLGYAYAGVGDIPFSAWDVENNRQLNVCFVEDADAGNANLKWDMGWDGSTFGDLGSREYVFIMNSDYNDGVDYDDNNWGPGADVLYAFWPQGVEGFSYLQESFEFRIYAANPNTPAHSFVFTAPAVLESRQIAEEAVEKVTVYPNPYYAYNPQESGRYSRFITFYHLPRRAIIRIFDLSGTLVRKLEKNDNSQFLRWHLTNKRNLLVGSGIYIAHIEMPELGKEKILKFVIIQAEQVVDFF